MDEEILQDFLVEAGEIIENLDEQLVQIEKTPDDTALLNAIFRGFHTVKGGAGFLELKDLVEICHAAESVFDMLRNGRIKMSPVLMDAILQAHDEISRIFGEVQNREPIVPAPAELISRLHDIAEGKVSDEAPAAAPAPAPEPAPAPAPEPVEVKLPEPEPVEVKLPEPEPAAAEPETANCAEGEGSIDDITEDEFEALLDQLHGKGKAPGTDGDLALQGHDDTDSDFDAMLESAGVTSGASHPVDEKGELKVATDEEFNKAKAVAEAPQVPQPAAPVSPAPQPSPSREEKSATDKGGKGAAASGLGEVAETTVRVDTQVLDDIMNMVGELVLVRNRLLSIAAHRSDQEMSQVISNLDVVTGDLQGAVMKTRMQPIKKVFGRFPRVVRDLARKLNKKIELRMEGEDTELDKNLVDALADPMVHMVRNCCDHGIEDPQVRLSHGKKETGTVVLAASQQGDHILLEISDDGQGMDPQILKQVAIRKGVIDEATAERLSDDDALNLIFAPGFSTNTEVTDISGRGVGMDVVKTNIAKLNGSVRVISKYGEGTTIEIKVPLTLAILPTLMVSVNHRTFALPLTSVSEIFYLSLDSMRIVDGLNTIVIRDRPVPLFFLKQWFENAPTDEYFKNKAHIVLVQASSTQLVGFVVDELLGQEEVVIKPLDSVLRHTPGMAGATVTSDGGIALIVDIPGLIRAYGHKNLSRF